MTPSSITSSRGNHSSYNLKGSVAMKYYDNDWPTWKTIKLGTGIKDANGFRQAIKDAGMCIGRGTNDIIGKPEFVVATEEIEVDLVKVTPYELGFKKHPQLGHIYDRVKELGLELCPPEVGPQLRLQLRDQFMNQWVYIGMEPIPDSEGCPELFYVGHSAGVRRSNPDGYLVLFSIFGNLPCTWNVHKELAFVRPRK